jgi:site-specific DNA-methyltransferase (cytosine-N4-specific)
VETKNHQIVEIKKVFKNWNRRLGELEMNQKTTTLGGKIIDDWTFKKSNTQYLTHGLHPYPARMVPQLAKKLILNYSEENDWVLDPFCGSGTSLVEAMLNNRNSIGNDLNPLAVLLSKVKSTPLEKKELGRLAKKVLYKAREEIQSFRTKYSKTKIVSIDKWTKNEEKPTKFIETIDVPKFDNINLWFKENVIFELAILRKIILTLDCEPSYRDFFKICLSFTAMKSSNADFGSHQAHPSRYKPSKLAVHSPNVLSIFQKKTADSVKRIINFSEKVSNNDVSCFVSSGDARKLDLTNLVPNQGIDIIVTSPPYGEEKNTVGYHRWAKIMAYWIGFSRDEMKKSEEMTLGSKGKIEVDIPSKTAMHFVDLVKEKAKSKNRAANLASFFDNYNDTLVQMAKWVKNGGIAAIVVGNRLVSGHRIAMDRVTVELAKQSGLIEEKTFYRDIPNTIMPKRIPEGETIAKESIIILRKT